MARYNPNGALDDSFGGDGKVGTPFAREAVAGGVAIQADGKIVVVGRVLTRSGGESFAVVRYKPSGALDDTFGEDGRVRTSFGDLVAFASGVAIQADGNIVLAGEQRLPSFDRKFALARYKPNGALDDTFGGDGKVTTRFAVGPRVAFASGVAIQNDGKVVAAGTVFVDNRARFAVARYLAA